VERSRYDSDLDDARSRARTWQRVAVGVLVIDLILALRLVTLDTREKTIVMPPVAYTEFWVKGNEVSPSYLEAMGRYFTGLMLTYDPSSFAAQKDVILRYADPSAHGALEARLSEDADRIARERLSQVFFPAQTRVRSESLAVAFSGDLAAFVGEQPTDPHHATYVIRFINRGGQLFVASFKEAADENDPFDDRAADRPGASPRG
jgi:conjugal transfer pilus assembly protein TraE